MSELEAQPQTGDGISALHRMSTTAGVAASEYVAINNLAIVALVLGLSTALAVAWAPFLLLGIAGVACGIIAVRQVRSSNGTQTGAALAIAGIALSVLLAGASYAISYARKAALKPDQEAINRTVAQLGEHLAAGRYREAYDLFDASFRNGTPETRAVPYEEFEGGWRGLMGQAGGFAEFRGNNIFEFKPYREGRELHAYTKAVFRFQTNVNEGRLTVWLRRQEDGSWRILNLPDLFDLQPRKSPPRM